MLDMVTIAQHIVISGRECTTGNQHRGGQKQTFFHDITPYIYWVLLINMVGKQPRAQCLSYLIPFLIWLNMIPDHFTLLQAFTKRL
jgi:hypothetical protein